VSFIHKNWQTKCSWLLKNSTASYGVNAYSYSLQDPKSYENMRNAIGILKLISQGEEEIRRGKSKSQEEVFEHIEDILFKRLVNSKL